MANSYVQYAGTGAQTQFSLTFPYLDKAHIGVKVNGVVTAFTWINSTTIAVAVAPALAAVVELRRTTPISEAIVNFQDGAVVTEDQLDTNAKQALFAAQEDQDAVAVLQAFATNAAASAAAAAASQSAAATSATGAATSASAAATSATAAAASAATLVATSATAATPSVASKVFTTQAGKSLGIGAFILIASASTPTVWMFGQVTAYTGTSLTIDSQVIGTASAKSDWNIWLAGARGATGATGAPGADGQGVPTGGAGGTFLKKNSGTNFDTAWAALAIADLPSDFSGSAAWQTWTPTDASGASLTFSSVNAKYTRIGNLIFAFFYLTFPATGNTNAIRIGSLPVAVPSQSYAFSYTTLSLNGVSAGGSGNLNLKPIAGQSYAEVWPSVGTAAIGNNSLASLSVSGMIIYPAS